MTGQTRDTHGILWRPGETNRAIGRCRTAHADKEALGTVLLLNPEVTRRDGFICCQQAILRVGKQAGIGRTTGGDGSRTDRTTVEGDDHQVGVVTGQHGLMIVHHILQALATWPHDAIMHDEDQGRVLGTLVLTSLVGCRYQPTSTNYERYYEAA